MTSTTYIKNVYNDPDGVSCREDDVYGMRLIMIRRTTVLVGGRSRINHTGEMTKQYAKCLQINRRS
jgi:hypothetical protein